MREPCLPADVPQPLDQELLAWAAGFFDGEGTTIARTEKHREDYFRLDMSVPQAGRIGIPQVLLTFQRAMLGIGRIYLDRHGLYKWRAGGRVGADVSLALMWPYLGVVKRAQATEALERVEAQYAVGRYVQRRPRNVPVFIAHTPARVREDRSAVALAWAAGFLDAEGCFGVTRLPARKDGSRALRVRVSASQHGAPAIPADVLVHLRDTLGVGRIERHGDIDDFKWTVSGEGNVRSVFDKVRPWLGEVKTQQALDALLAHRALRVRGTDEVCIRGHAYDGIDVRPDGSIHHRCSVCDGIRDVELGRRSMLGDAMTRYAA